MSRRRGSQRATEQYLPLGYFAVALLLVIALLPTVLRPPVAEPNQTAELSPDAEPDKEQQSIISSLSRAQSGTAGTSTGEFDDPVAPAVTVPPVVRRPASSRCFGTPARQTEVIYSPPCAPAWTGDNGGATWRNVTATEVNVGIELSLGNADYDGPIRTTAPPEGGESGANRTLRVFQQYFNLRYQLWGRTLRLVQIKDDDDSVEGSRAAAVQADEQWKVFAAIHEFPAFGEEFAKRKLVVFGNGWPAATYAENAPYTWAWLPDLDKEGRLGAELACKQLIGRPASFAGGTLSTRTRTFGMIANAEDNRRYRSAQFAEPFKSMCDGEVLGIDFDGSADQASVGTAIARLQSQNVTTVALSTDVLSALQILGQAQSQAYFPEWLLFNGSGCLTCNVIGKVMPQPQMSQAFGLSPWEMPRSFAESECHRAYHSIDPANDPDAFFCELGFLQLVQVMNGIQAAGPNLTPTTFERGLFGLGYSRHPEVWAIQGGYSASDRTWMDSVGEVWWDEAVNDPQLDSPGAYRWVKNGRRSAEGEIPREEPLFFTDGVTRPPPT